MSRKELKRKVAWALIGAMMLSNTGQAFAAAGWNKDARGWTYESETGSKVAAGWVLDGTTWYHMNKDGYMETGWFQDTDGRWYYLNPNVGGPQGSMMMGWVQDAAGKWYYMNPSVGGPQGSMMTGWITENGKRWYLNADGSWDGKEGILVSRSSGGGGGSSSGGGGGSTPTVDKMNLRVGDKDNTYGWSYDQTLKTYTVDSGEYTSITVTAEVGNDTVIIENINAATLSVQGGGSNSVVLRNTRIATVDMNKDSAAANAEAPRLLLEGMSAVEVVSVLKPAILESASKEPVISAVVAQNTLTVQGSTTNLDKVEASGTNALIHISESFIKEMTLSNGAEAMASSGGSVDTLKVKDAVMLTNLPVNTNLITEGDSTITIQGSTSVPEVDTDYPTKLISKGDSAQIAVVNTSTALTVENTIVDLVVTSGDNANIKADEKASLNSVLIESGTLTIESSDNKNINVGKVVANEGVDNFTVSSLVNITEVETRGDIEIGGEGSVNVVAAKAGTTITGTVGEAAAQITVTFLDSFARINKTVSYGEELPVLETTYYTGKGDATINWPAYTFTSKNPGTYTIVGTWSALPDGVRAGDVTPTAAITVNAPDTVNLTFAESNGLTGFDITLTSSDEGEVISKDSSVVSVIKGKTYTYTISKSGYEAASGTVKADASQNISITLNAVNEYFSLRFEAPGDWPQYTDRKLPANGNYISGTKLVLPKAHTRAGYDLSWKDDAGNTVSEAVASKNATYTASWTKIEYPIKYVGADVEGAKETYTVDDSSYTLPQPRAGDKVFCGWYTTASFSGQPVTTQPSASTGAKTYYARWITDMEAAGLLKNGVPVTSDVSKDTKELNKVLFAGGKAVAVNAYSDDKNLVTLDGTQYLAPVSLNIYAGDYNKDTDLTATGKITVNGGIVDAIFGGGAGDPTFGAGKKADVNGNVAITVKGGTVKRIYGGGSGRSVVTGNVTIDVQAADEDISSIFGGGAAPHGRLTNLSDNKSENHVGSVMIKVAEGVTLVSLTGGGISIASVDETTITLNGTVKARMIAGGTNGYVGKTTVTLGETAHLMAENAWSDPKYSAYKGMTIYQAGYRGIVGDVDLTVKSGAQIDGDIYLGTNSLYKDGQDAKITGSLTAVFEDGFQCDGDIYLGMGSNGDSLTADNTIHISGPVAISEMMYSQTFTDTTLDMIPDEIKDNVQIENGAGWVSGFAGGTGEEEDPFIIETQNQFKLMYSNVKYATGGYTFKLATDIELKQEDANVSGYAYGRDFSGTIDGDNHTIAYSGDDFRALFYYTSYGAANSGKDVTFKNINLHMKGKGGLCLTLATYSKNLLFDSVNVIGDRTVTAGTNDSAYVSQASNKVDSIKFTNCISSLNYNVTDYAAAFIGGYIQNKTDNNVTSIIFDGCVNNGNLSGLNPAVFIGNSNQCATINVEMENTYNRGEVVGTDTAGLFAQNNSNNVLKEYNEKFKHVTTSEGLISISKADDLVLGLNKATQEYYLKDTSDSKYVSYVLRLKAYARDEETGTLLISKDWNFESSELNVASGSNWRNTGVPAGKFVTESGIILGDNEGMEEVGDGTTEVGGTELRYTLYKDTNNEISEYYYVFEGDSIELFGGEYQFSEGGTAATVGLYGIDNGGKMYGPLNEPEIVPEGTGANTLLASPSNAAMPYSVMLFVFMEETDAEDDLAQKEAVETEGSNEDQKDAMNNTNPEDVVEGAGEEDTVKEDNLEKNSDPGTNANKEAKEGDSEEGKKEESEGEKTDEEAEKDDDANQDNGVSLEGTSTAVKSEDEKEEEV